MRACIIHAPDGYADELQRQVEGVRFLKRPGHDMDFVQVFAGTRAVLLRQLPRAVTAIAPEGMLWISWPKRSSGVITDIGETDVRRHGLSAGLVDVKICAVDETWSALKFVYRIADRASAAGSPAGRGR